MRACFGDAKALPGLGEAFWGVAGDVCAALAFLHRRSVIHGDVKAANVLLGNGGVAKISDFGLARVVGTAGFTRTSSSPVARRAIWPRTRRAGALTARGPDVSLWRYWPRFSPARTVADARNDVAIALASATASGRPRRSRRRRGCAGPHAVLGLQPPPDQRRIYCWTLDLRLDNEATVQDDGVEVIRSNATGCKQRRRCRRTGPPRRHPSSARTRSTSRPQAHGQRRLAGDWVDQRAARTRSQRGAGLIGRKCLGRAGRADSDDVRDGRHAAPAAGERSGATSNGRGCSIIPGRSWTAGRCSTRGYEMT